MPSFMPKVTQYNEMFHIWFFSAVSVFVGCSLIYLTSLENFYSFQLLGLAHLVVFLPAMLYTPHRVLNVIIASLLCALFPVWGVIVGVLTVGIGAPLTCSAVWGFIAMIVLRRIAAFWIILLVGVISNVVLLLPGGGVVGPNQRDLDDTFITALYIWYVLMLFAMPWIMSIAPTLPKSQCKGDLVCHECGYSLIDLPQELPCPECGSAREKTA